MDQVALRRQALEIGKHRLTTVPNLLDLIPLRRIGQGPPSHGLIPLQAIERHPQRTPAHG
jgi:hypothetical protein